MGARECRLVEVDRQIREPFFQANHIDGDVKSTAAWGLFLGNELLASLSVRRPLHRRWSRRLEVARFSVLTGCSVPGALSRLSRAALQESRSRGLEGLVSYVDTRYGDGSGYLASGYTLHSRTGPTFWWTDFNSRLNRFQFRADPRRGLSEEQIASEAGVTKLWGCDQLVVTLG